VKGPPELLSKYRPAAEGQEHSWTHCKGYDWTHPADSESASKMKERNK